MRATTTSRRVRDRSSFEPSARASESGGKCVVLFLFFFFYLFSLGSRHSIPGASLPPSPLPPSHVPHPSPPVQARRVSAVNAPPTHPIAGELLKRSKMGKWQRRWFSTHSHYLLYQRKRGGEFLGGVDLGPTSAIELVVADGVEIGLSISGLDGDAHSANAGEARERRVFDLR